MGRMVSREREREGKAKKYETIRLLHSLSLSLIPHGVLTHGHSYDIPHTTSEDSGLEQSFTGDSLSAIEFHSRSLDGEMGRLACRNPFALLPLSTCRRTMQDRIKLTNAAARFVAVSRRHNLGPPAIARQGLGIVYELPTYPKSQTQRYRILCCNYFPVLYSKSVINEK